MKCFLVFLLRLLLINFFNFQSISILATVAINDMKQNKRHNIFVNDKPRTLLIWNSVEGKTYLGFEKNATIALHSPS